MNARASSPTSPSSVAEKSIVCRSLGRRRTILLDLRLEAHVEHAVGLVENEDPHIVELDEAPLDEILQAAGRGDEDVRAAAAASPGWRSGAAVGRRDTEAASGLAIEVSSSATCEASSRVGTSTSAVGVGAVGVGTLDDR